MQNEQNDSLPMTIEDNFNGLFTFLAEKCGIKHSFSETICWVNSSPFCWPNFVFKARFTMDTIDRELAKTVDGIRRKIAPPFWLIGPGSETADLGDRLLEHGLRQVNSWPGMALDLEGWVAPEFAGGSPRIRIAADRNDLSAWHSVAGPELFPKKELDLGMLLCLLDEPAITFFTAYHEDAPVATAMSFASAQVVGLYMIATAKTHRGKGFGSAITVAALRHARAEGRRTAILQSTPSGFGLYRRLGFKEHCRFDVFWMLGDEFR